MTAVGDATARGRGTIPIRLGAPGLFSTLRTGLQRAGYDAAGIGARLGIDSIYAFRSVSDGRAPQDPARDALSLLIHVFLDGQVVGRALVDRMLEPPVVQALDALGLLRDAPTGGRECLATVLLYPTESLLIVSDRDYDPTSADPDHTVLTSDSVYPAITTNTGDFLSFLPDTPCEQLLDLCSGTGIAALVQAPRSGHAWAVDITERSTVYARFNAALNGIGNVTALQGDLYDAVSGRTFDRIVAHPPYVPALRQEYIYRDAGADGEQVTRRIVEGLPAHLAEGGTFHCVCMATDRRGAPLQERLRTMLGASAPEFDVAVATTATFTPAEHYALEMAQGRISPQDCGAHLEAMADLEVERLVVAAFVIRRHGEQRPGITARRRRGTVTAGREALDWLLRWEAAAARPADLDARLVEARPRLAPGVRLHLVSRADGGAWKPEEFAIATDAPFPYTLQADGNVAQFLARCDGRRSVREHLERLVREGAVPEGTTARQFAAMVRPLIGAGFIELEAFRLPGPPGARTQPQVEEMEDA